LSRQIKARRQNAPDRFNVAPRQGRDQGGPEVKGPFKLPRQIENPVQVFLGPLRPGQAAGERGVFVPWALDVHGEHIHKSGRKQIPDNVRPLAVGIHFHGQAQSFKFREKIGQARDHGGLAACDHNTFQP